MAHYDTVIIGAGHNGLVCANYLARQNQKVLVLESSSTIGGLASTREFHPGFKVSVAHTAGHFSKKIHRDLSLQDHGLSLTPNPLSCVGLDLQGNHIVVDGHTVSGVPESDQAAYLNYSKLTKRFANLLAPFWLKTAPPIGNNSLPEVLSFAQLGLKMRMLGKQDMREFLRIIALPTHDLMNEYFDHPILKALLSWNGLIGSKQAPRSPNNSIMLMLYRMSGGMNGLHELPVGGVSGLINALRSSAESRGVEIRTNTPVDRIAIDRGEEGLRATGVQVDDGEQVSARNIVSSVDPKTTFLTLLGAENLEIEFANRIRRIRSQGLVAKLHLALNGLPIFTGLDRSDGQLIISPDMETIENAFDDSKYGQCPAEPVMEIVIPSLHDPSLAPDGQHVLSAHVMYVPYKMKKTWDSATKDAFTNKLIDKIALYAPAIREQIIASELLTPTDLEQRFRVAGGHWHHGEFALDQLFMMRPTYGAGQYQSPVQGLYLCGAGTHPGGDITGSPGHNAAHEILS